MTLATEGGVAAASGRRSEGDAETLCLHGDTDGAADLLSVVRAALDARGVEVRAFA